MLLCAAVIVDCLLRIVDYCCANGGSAVRAPLLQIQNFHDIVNQCQSTIRLSTMARSLPPRMDGSSYSRLGLFVVV